LQATFEGTKQYALHYQTFPKEFRAVLWRCSLDDYQIFILDRERWRRKRMVKHSDEKQGF